jgi:hypothetical protein
MTRKKQRTAKTWKSERVYDPNYEINKSHYKFENEILPNFDSKVKNDFLFGF